MSAAASPAAALPARPVRHDGWTPDRQRRFLESVAEGHSVGEACALVGLSPASAYALRRRAAGASFRLGWDAANLLARDKIADTLLARAIEGQVDTYTRGDGTVVTRHRYDNRLAANMLARLDRLADESHGSPHHAARLVAQEFDAFLDMVERDGGPARTGLFVGARVASEDADRADLDPVLALARADRYLRGRAGMAGEVETRDLDPERRAEWTAEQWARAEAAGLIVIADPESDDDMDWLDAEDEGANPNGVDLDAIDLSDEDWAQISRIRAERAVQHRFGGEAARDAPASQLSQLRPADPGEPEIFDDPYDEESRRWIEEQDRIEEARRKAVIAEFDALFGLPPEEERAAPAGNGPPSIRQT